MTDQATNSGGANAPAPSNNASGDTGAQSSFIRSRVAQMSAQTPPPAPSDNAPAVDTRQQQSPPAEQKIKVGEAEYTAADLESAIAERAEAQSRKATLPSSADGYEIKLPDGFQAPEGVRFEFNPHDPALKAARELAHKHGVSQDVFSQMLGVYASTKMGEAIQQSQLRDVNMKQLGTAARNVSRPSPLGCKLAPAATAKRWRIFCANSRARRSSRRWKI
jgi:hypothetical protein